MDAKLFRQRSFIVRLLLASGILCVIGLWTFEVRTGLISHFDTYAYPALLAAFCASLVMMSVNPKWRMAAEWGAYLSFCLYCACAVVSFRSLAPETRLYTIANTLQWMPLTYVTAFLLFPRLQGLVAAGIGFALSMGALSWLWLSGDVAQWTYVHGALILNAYVVHLLTLIILSLFIVTQDAFERVRRQAKVLESAALTDALTGVANRRGLERALMRHATEPGQPVALILLDMDHFKAVNDQRGHVYGDRMLQAMVGAVREELRDEDVIGRWGGDEFLVIVEGTSAEGARRLAERLRQVVAGMPEALETGVTLSAGVSLWDGDGGLEAALHRVDAALYQAKHQGRDRVALAEPAGGALRSGAAEARTAAPHRD